MSFCDPKRLLAVTAMCLVPVSVSAQTWQDDVGYIALLIEKGPGLETGAGVKVVQPEAPQSGNGAYMPNAAAFPGKTFTDGATTPSTGFSGHATGVGHHFYGSGAIGRGITDITGYNASAYLLATLGATVVTTKLDPLPQGFDVGNHSYIQNTNNATYIADRTERFDFVINRDNTVMVVATNNGGTTPAMLASSYNAITVGKTNGTHAHGLTQTYGAGRSKPDLVAPSNFTSNATPMVAGAAAMLREAAAGTNAIQNEVIKANLFAGATKGEFPGWDRTTTRPVDETFGFGELNIFNSYHIFEGGEFAGATTDPASNVGKFGWDYADFDGSSDLYYDFNIAAGQTATELSAALVWNLDVVDNDPTGFFDPVSSLANLDLQLYDSTGTFLGSVVDSSLSTVYNHEHIYQTGLGAGDYTFRVSGDSATDFALSWRISTVPEPTSAVMLTLIALGTRLRRRS